MFGAARLHAARPDPRADRRTAVAGSVSDHRCGPGYGSGVVRVRMRVGAGCVRQLRVPVAASRQEGVTKFRKLARPIREDSEHCLAVGVAECDISACVDGEADVLRKSLLAGSVEPQREPSRRARRHLALSDPHVSWVPDVTTAKPRPCRVGHPPAPPRTCTGTSWCHRCGRRSGATRFPGSPAPRRQRSACRRSQARRPRCCRAARPFRSRFAEHQLKPPHAFLLPHDWRGGREPKRGRDQRPAGSSCLAPSRR